MYVVKIIKDPPYDWRWLEDHKKGDLLEVNDERMKHGVGAGVWTPVERFRKQFVKTKCPTCGHVKKVMSKIIIEPDGKEEADAKRREYYQKNVEKIRAYQREYHKHYKNKR